MGLAMAAEKIKNAKTQSRRAEGPAGRWPSLMAIGCKHHRPSAHRR